MDEDGLTSWEAPPRGESGPRPPLNLRQIEVFRAIMLSGSISGAGRMLHVSQPAVSRVLALMESRLRYPLFERSRSRLTPTAEARRLYAEVEQVYGGIQRVNELAASLGEAGAGMLRVVSSASFGQRMVPMALRALRAARANVRVDYRSATFDELPGHFLGGHADIAVSMQPPDHPNLTAVELGRSPVVCLLPREHALAARQVIRPDDFRSGAWVGYPVQTPLGTALRSFFGAAGMPPAAVEVHSPVTAAAFVQQGLGPGLVDAWCVGPELRRSVALRPIDPPAHVGIWATYSDLQPLPLMARRFLAVLRKVIASEPAPGRAIPIRGLPLPTDAFPGAPAVYSHRALQSQAGRVNHRGGSHAMTHYELIGSRGCGSAIVEAALRLTGLDMRLTDIPYLKPGPGRERLLTLNPLGQVPTLILPGGAVLTESAAMILHLNDAAPHAGLAPAPGSIQRVRFFELLIRLTAAVYPTFTFGDHPSRWTGEGEAARRLRAATDARREMLWRNIEQQVGAPHVLGDQLTALDLYVTVMTHWRPRRRWFDEHCPRLAAIADQAAAHSQIADVLHRHFSGAGD